MQSNDSILWYFADPMCSWCWGFSPVIQHIMEDYEGRLKFALVLGGLRTGAVQPMSAQQREEILHHWHEVHRMTGQAFQFEGAMPEGFIYDTEPACRAVAAVSSIDINLIFPMFKAVQSAFYTRGMDVTQTGVLTDIAVGLGVQKNSFRQSFESEESHRKTQAHFQQTRQYGVRGFPTIILQRESGYSLLNSGYKNYDDLKGGLEEWLAE